MEFTKAMVGKPFMWTTENYGKVAVHVTGFSPNGAVALLSIDGGEASTPAQRFPELADGTGFATLGQLSKRHVSTTTSAARKAAAAKATDPVPGNAIAKRPVRKRAASRVEFKSGEVTF